MLVLSIVFSIKDFYKYKEKFCNQSYLIMIEFFFLKGGEVVWMAYIRNDG